MRGDLVWRLNKPSTTEKRVWTSVAILLAALSLWFYCAHEGALRAVAAADNSIHWCGTCQMMADLRVAFEFLVSVMIPTALGITALFISRRIFKVIMAVLVLIFAYFSTMSSLFLLHNLPTYEATKALLPVAKPRALAIGFVMIWLFTMLLRELLARRPIVEQSPRSSEPPL